jgi:hypothetical protein
VLSGRGERAGEARPSADALQDGVPTSDVVVRDFPDGFFPYEGQRIKDFFEELKADYSWSSCTSAPTCTRTTLSAAS